jgi:hypothetical protein
MATIEDEPDSLSDRRQDPHVLRLIRWLLEDASRTLPLPDDAEAIDDLIQATGISPEFTQALMARVYGEGSGSEAAHLLT